MPSTGGVPKQLTFYPASLDPIPPTSLESVFRMKIGAEKLLEVARSLTLERSLPRKRE